MTATARWRPPTARATAAAGKVRYQVRAVRLSAHGKVLGTKTSAKLGASIRHKMVLSRGAYRFQVRATNAAGDSAWSARSNKVRAR